jgi:hypothetical protein
MLPLIEVHKTELAELCRRFRIARLELFGSAARGTDFDSQRSDIDLLVTYAPKAAPTFDEYFDLSEQLAALFGRSVDLVMSGAVRNPFLRAGIERSKELLYAA